MRVAVLPGEILDQRASDPLLMERTPVLSARLGPTELALLQAMALELGLTRSSLTRRLVVKGLVELQERVQ